MSYHVYIRKKDEEKKYYQVFYTEEDLISLLIKLRNWFTSFDGALLYWGMRSIVELQILERNWDWFDAEWMPTEFFPFPIGDMMTFENKAGTFQTMQWGIDPVELDVSENYISAYILEAGKEYIVELCKYDKMTATLYINNIPIEFQKNSNNTCILENIASNKKNSIIYFGTIRENKIGNDSLEENSSFYSARGQINKRVNEKVPIKEFIWLGDKALYSRYLGKDS